MNPETLRDLYATTSAGVLVVVGLTLLAIGFFLRHYLLARRFNRTDIGGIQRFSSYGWMRLTLFWEELAHLVCRVSQFFAVMVLLGAVVKYLE